MRAFVSSTYIDLVAERESLQALFTRLNTRYVGMELFPASSKTPLAVALQHIATCDVVIFLVAHRYGSIDQGSGKSILELEYEAAVAGQKEILVYFKDPLSPVTIDHIDTKYSDKFRAFKDRLNQHHRQIFRNADHLTTLVALDIFDRFSKFELWTGISQSTIDCYKQFWAETFQGLGATLVMEVGRHGAHLGEVEVAKNINGVLGVAKLLPALQQLNIDVDIKAATAGLDLNRNLILDGSPTGNSLTKYFMNHPQLSQTMIYRNSHSDDRKVRWLEIVKTGQHKYNSVYKGTRTNRTLNYDYGFLSRIRNPFSPSKQCLIASGNHGAGTYACMSVLATPELLERIYCQVKSKPFQAVVGVEMGQIFRLGSPVIYEVVTLEDK